MTSTFTTTKGSDSYEAFFRKATREGIERLAQQVRAEVAREIFTEIDKNKWVCDGAACLVIGVDDDDPFWQSLKAKYLGGK